MPCYDPEPAYSHEIKENSLKASQILCKLVSSNLNAGVEVPLDILEWYLQHRKIDLKIQEDGLMCVLHGGAWFSSPHHCRSASRHRYLPDITRYYAGFRVTCHSPGEGGHASQQSLAQHPLFSLAAEINSLQSFISAKNQQNES